MSDSISSFQSLLSQEVFDIIKRENYLAHLFEKLERSISSIKDKIERDEYICLVTGALLYNRTNMDKCMIYLEKVREPCWTQYSNYIEATIYYKQDNYMEALTKLTEIDRDVSTISNQMKSFRAHLFGLCLSHMGKPYCSIQKYKEALTYDFSFLLPLYDIALEYKKLGLIDAELEALNLLVTALRDESETLTVENLPLTLQLLDFSNNLIISLPQAMYVMATRCQQGLRYKEASHCYKDLVSLLQESIHFKIKGTRSILLPPIKNMYEDLIFSLQKCKEYSSCLSVCDDVLHCEARKECYTSYMSQGPSPPSKENVSRKRLRSSDTPELSISRSSSHLDLYAHIIKADTLIYLDRIQEALIVVERVEKIIYEDAFKISQTVSTNLDAPSPLHKRQRIGSGENCVLKPMHHGNVLKIKSALTQMYKHLGTVMAEQRKHQDALHCLGISIQLDPGQVHAFFNLSLVLWDMDRPKEASLRWCKFRNLDYSVDSFQTANLLVRKKSTLSALTYDEKFEDLQYTLEVTDSMMLKLDIRCLEYVIRSGGAVV